MRWPAPRPLHAWQMLTVFLGLAICCHAPEADAGIITEIEVTASAYADHRNGSNFADYSELTENHPTHAYVQTLAAMQGSGHIGFARHPFDFSSRAAAASMGHVYSDGSGFLVSRVSIQAHATNGVMLKDAFSNEPARANAAASVLLRVDNDRQVFIRGDIGRQNTQPGIVLSQDARTWIDRNSRETSEMSFAHATGVWTLETNPSGAPVFPGTTPDLALPGFAPWQVQIDELFTGFVPEEDMPATPPSQVTGSFLTGETAFVAPVQAEYGTTDRLYFKGTEPVAAIAPIAAALAEVASATTAPLGYYFSTLGDSPLFASFSLADIDPDQAYEIFFDGIRRTLLGSEVIDFTAFDPDGVSSFFLRELDSRAGEGSLRTLSAGFSPAGSSRLFLNDLSSRLGNPIPSVFSASFVGEGTAQFAVGAVHAPAAPSAVPEPGSLALLATGGIGLVGGWFRRRRNPSRDNSAAA